MRILSFMAIVGMAVALTAQASAQLHAPVYPTWTALISPELAQSKSLPEPSAELQACFDVHRAALIKKSENVSPLVIDHLGDDPLRRECAMAAEVDALATRWKRSSSINGYGPLITFISNQNKSLAKKSELEKCQGRQFMFDSATTFNDMIGGMAPKFTYEWVKPLPGAPCLPAQ